MGVTGGFPARASAKLNTGCKQPVAPFPEPSEGEVGPFLSTHESTGLSFTANPAERALAEIAELAGGLAHELRNPLSTMMINLKLLAEDLQDGNVGEGDVRRRGLLKIDVLRREAERLQALFDEFLSLTGPYSLQRTLTDLNAIVARLVEFCEPMMNAHKVRITQVAKVRPLECSVDEKLLSRALLNLAINAQQAMPRGGELTVTTEGDGAVAVIRVSDSGVGIADYDRDRVFRPFFSTKPNGTGLGLSITQRIIQEHGGSLDFVSEVGQGTAFTIRLPRSPKPD